MLQLTDLPPEIIERICLTADDEDLTTLRLVCKSICAIVERHWFYVIYLEPRDDSFKRLQAISRVPRLAAYVREIHFEATCYQVLSQDQWYHEIRSYTSESVDTYP